MYKAFYRKIEIFDNASSPIDRIARMTIRSILVNSIVNQTYLSFYLNNFIGEIVTFS